MHRKLSIPQEVDVLICAGDVISDFSADGLDSFWEWFLSCPVKLRIFIPGNHEIVFDFYPEKAKELVPEGVVCLEDNGVEFCGIAFYSVTTRSLQQNKWLHQETIIPANTDILITHIPPYGFLDEDAGDSILRNIVLSKRPKIHLFGHIHSQGGESLDGTWTRFFNVSKFNELEVLYHC